MTNQALEYAHTIAAEVRELEDGRTEDGPTVTAYEAVLDWAESAVLDLEWTESSNARTITAVTILRTFGGPNAWIDAHGDGTVTVRAAGWGERGEVRTDAPTLDAWAWEAAEVGRAMREVRA